MPEAGPSVDRSSPPSTDPPVPATQEPPSSEHDQSETPSNAQRTSTPSLTDVGMTVEFPSPSHTIPERTSAHYPELPITPPSAAQPPGGNQITTVPLLPPAMPENPPEELPHQHRTTRGRLFAFFGLGSGPELRERKELMSLIWNLGFNGAQVRKTVVSKRIMDN
jgi:hypothetical protein